METKYDPLTQYCSIRRELEERSQDLVGRLAAMSGRLLRLTGHDHEAFVDTKVQCQTLRTVIGAAWREVQEHRSAHGC